MPLILSPEEVLHFLGGVERLKHRVILTTRYAAGLRISEAVRLKSASRGLAMGAYAVFLDVALGFGSPALGLIAGWAGPSAVFLVSALAALSAGAVASQLLVAASPVKELS